MILSRNSMQLFLLHCSCTIPGARQYWDLAWSLGVIQRWEKDIPVSRFLRSLWGSSSYLYPKTQKREQNSRSLLRHPPRIKPLFPVFDSSLPPSSQMTFLSNSEIGKWNMTNCIFPCLFIKYLNVGFWNSKAKNFILFFFWFSCPAPFFEDRSYKIFYLLCKWKGYKVRERGKPRLIH